MDLSLALQAQDLADLDDPAANPDDKSIEGNTPSDAHIARDFYRQELRNKAAIISDLRFGEKVGEAAGDEARILYASVTPTFDQTLVEKFGLLTTESNSAMEDNTHSFNRGGTGHQTCVSCTEKFRAHHLITALCGDHYCKTCIGRLYDLAMKDESLFPPRCCRQPIPLGIATPLLTSAQVQTFLEKRDEFNTPNRIYCHNTICGAFVTPGNVSGEKAMCTCGELTCIVCKAAAHEGDCPEDPAYASLMAVASAEGYQTCPQCKRLVELSIGCNHMT